MASKKKVGGSPLSRGNKHERKMLRRKLYKGLTKSGITYKMPKK